MKMLVSLESLHSPYALEVKVEETLHLGLNVLGAFRGSIEIQISWVTREKRSQWASSRLWNSYG